MRDRSQLPFIPQSWEWATLGEVAEIKLGKMLSGKAYKAGLKQLPYLRNLNIRWYSIDLSDLKRMGFTPTEVVRYQVCAGDLLVCEGGEPGRCAVYSGDVNELMYQKALHRVRPYDALMNVKFIQYFFACNIQNRLIFPRKSETTIKHLPLEKMILVPVSVPPLNEQRRIVAKIEELFSDLDAGVAALERARAKLKRYRAAVLKAAVEGKLTEAWRKQHPDAEPAEKLLARILAERRRAWEADQLAKFSAKGKEPPKNWKAKYKEPAAPDTTQLPKLPKGWCWATVDQVLHGIEAGKSFKCLSRPANQGEWGVIKVSAMSWGKFLESENKAIPQGKKIDPKNEIHPGDILLSRSNTVELVGATVLVAKCRAMLLLSDKSMRLLPCNGLKREWFQNLMSSKYVRKQLSLAATGTSDSMRNVSQEKVLAITVPLPPQEEQQTINSAIDQLLSQGENATVEVDSSLRRAARLRQSILKRAFEGKLVPQDARDEPASVLLERIKAQRSEVEGKTKPRGRKPKVADVPELDPDQRRASVLCYLVQKSRDLGRTKLQKLLYLSHYHADRDLGFRFERNIAGPYTPALTALEGRAALEGWFTANESSKRVRYTPGKNIARQAKLGAAVLGDARAEVDRVIKTVNKLDTEQTELFATIHAVWNDLLLDGQPVTDLAIIDGVRSWHEKKKRFRPEEIMEQIRWIKQHRFEPRGLGPHTNPVGGEGLFKHDNY